jgi:hypothetical protein
MSLIVLFLEFLSSLVEFNLRSLGRGDFFLKFLLLPADFNRELFNLQVELSYLSVVFLPIFL